MGLSRQLPPAATKVLTGPLVAQRPCTVLGGLFRSQAGPASERGWWRGGGRGTHSSTPPPHPDPSSICFSSVAPAVCAGGRASFLRQQNPLETPIWASRLLTGWVDLSGPPSHPTNCQATWRSCPRGCCLPAAPGRPWLPATHPSSGHLVAAWSEPCRARDRLPPPRAGRHTPPWRESGGSVWCLRQKEGRTARGWRGPPSLRPSVLSHHLSLSSPLPSQMCPLLPAHKLSSALLLVCTEPG